MKTKVVNAVLWVLLSVSAVVGQTVKVFTGPDLSSTLCDPSLLDCQIIGVLDLKGINDNGQLSGYWQISDTFNITQSVIVDAATGNFTNLPMPKWGSPGYMFLSKITNLGRVVGDESLISLQTTQEKEHDGVVGTVTAMRLFKVIGSPATFGRSVDDNGGIVGNYANIREHGFYYHAPSTSTLKYFEDIMYPSSLDSWVSDINNSGDLLGYYDLCSDGGSCPVYGFVRHAGQYSQIVFPGALDTRPLGMNDSGAVVGTFRLSADPSQDRKDHGFTFINGVYKQVDIGTYTYLEDINNLGEIVGHGIDVPGLPFSINEGSFVIYPAGAPLKAGSVISALNPVDKHNVLK